MQQTSLSPLTSVSILISILYSSSSIMAGLCSLQLAEGHRGPPEGKKQGRRICGIYITFMGAVLCLLYCPAGTLYQFITVSTVQCSLQPSSHSLYKCVTQVVAKHCFYSTFQVGCLREIGAMGK